MDITKHLSLQTSDELDKNLSSFAVRETIAKFEV